MTWDTSSIRDRFKPILMAGSKIVENLQLTQLSNELTSEEISDLATHLKVYKLNDEDVLFNEGDAESYMGILVRGNFVVLKEDALGRRRKISSIGPGKTVGEMSLVDGEPRSASIQVHGEAVVMILYEGHFKDILANKPHLGVKLMKYITELMSARLRMTSTDVIESLDRD